MKRGISPLIGWVVLVGFAVATGLLVTQWAVQQFKDIDLPEDREGYCNDVDIELVGNCVTLNVDMKHVEMNITNKGLFTLTRFTFGRMTSNEAEAWCVLLNEKIPPGNTDPTNPNSRILSLSVVDRSQDINHAITTQKCNDPNLEGDELTLFSDITSLELVPWIEIEGDSFFCYDKRITLNSTTINECII